MRFMSDTLFWFLVQCFVYSFVNGSICENSSGGISCCVNYMLLTNGTCVECPIGFFGTDCNFTCPTNYYGRFCLYVCDCYEDEVCHNEHGCKGQSRECPIGFFGTDCNITCPTNYYGRFCRDVCNCNEDEVCHNEHGCIEQSRECPIGFFGTDCNITCPTNYYGRFCRDVCNCNEDEVCHNEHGCIEQSRANTSDDWKLIAIFSIVLLIIVLGLGGFLYKMERSVYETSNHSHKKAFSSYSIVPYDYEQTRFSRTDIVLPLRRRSRPTPQATTVATSDHQMTQSNHGNVEHDDSSDDGVYEVIRQSREVSFEATFCEHKHAGSRSTYYKGSHLKSQRCCTLSKQQNTSHYSKMAKYNKISFKPLFSTKNKNDRCSYGHMWFGNKTGHEKAQQSSASVQFDAEENHRKSKFNITFPRGQSKSNLRDQTIGAAASNGYDLANRRGSESQNVNRYSIVKGKLSENNNSNDYSLSNRKGSESKSATSHSIVKGKWPENNNSNFYSLANREGSDSKNSKLCNLASKDGSGSKTSTSDSFVLGDWPQNNHSNYHSLANREGSERDNSNHNSAASGNLPENNHSNHYSIANGVCFESFNSNSYSLANGHIQESYSHNRYSTEKDGWPKSNESRRYSFVKREWSESNDSLCSKEYGCQGMNFRGENSVLLASGGAAEQRMHTKMDHFPNRDVSEIVPCLPGTQRQQLLENENDIISDTFCKMECECTQDRCSDKNGACMTLASLPKREDEIQNNANNGVEATQKSHKEHNKSKANIKTPKRKRTFVRACGITRT